MANQQLTGQVLNENVLILLLFGHAECLECFRERAGLAEAKTMAWIVLHQSLRCVSGQMILNTYIISWPQIQSEMNLFVLFLF